MSKLKIYLAYGALLTSISCFIFMYYRSAHEGNDYEDIIANFNIVTPLVVKENVEKKDDFILFFGSDECDPCKEYAPILLESGTNKKKLGLIHYFSIDDEKYSKVAKEEYGITATPTTLTFKDGEIVKRQVGLYSETELNVELDSLNSDL